MPIQVMATTPSTTIEAPSRFRELQNTFLGRGLIKAFVRASGFLPVWFMRLFALGIVLPLAIPLTRTNFQEVRGNLRRMDPGKSGFKRALEACSVYKNYTYYLIDMMYLSHGPERAREYSVTITGGENLWRALEKGTGVLLLTSHLGNWEMGGRALAGIGRKIHVAYAPDSSNLFEHRRSLMRGDEAVHSVILKPGGMTSLTLYRLLADGELVAIQGDRLLFDRGLPVSFFGSPARFPQGPIRLAQLSGSPLVPIFIPMKGYKSYEIIIEAPLEMAAQDRTEDNLARVVSVLERHIGKYRTQWYTFRSFWEADLRKETD
ncbi:MAG: lysophospholipid acyltransferase family protein [Deltaproteobacteria bacterium]|nr:lysophospholipid acyltransferase family protein [Deltaproteobacteria bacterium]